MNTYQIAEVAQRTGFTPATLRYYEDIGLMAPVGRTPAGYRLYDDASLERLRFIARAKQLGCSLGEITDLALAWDGGECGPVQDQLRSTVESKIDEAQGRIAELMTFAAELQRAAAALGRHRPDGPCDDDCGCVSNATDTSGTNGRATAPTGGTETRAAATSGTETNGRATAPTGGTSVPLVAKSDAAADVQVACTLGAGEMTGRLEAWKDLLQQVTARLGLEDGVRLEFGASSDVGEIARLAAAEQDCCRFFSFVLVIDNRGAALEVHAPPDAADVVSAMFGAPQ